jgi:diguanylate cyclase (GGDEF)-like protein/PAS domain S-box-containing protein
LYCNLKAPLLVGYASGFYAGISFTLRTFGAFMLLYGESPSQIRILLLLGQDADSASLIKGMSESDLPCTIQECRDLMQLDQVLNAEDCAVDVLVIDLTESHLKYARQLMQISHHLPIVMLAPTGHEDWVKQAVQLKNEHFLIKDSAGGFLALLPIVLLRAINESREQHARTSAELDMMEHRLSLSQIVEGSPVASFVIDCNHVVTHWNQACEIFTGKKAYEMIGTSNQWQAFYLEKRPVLADLMLDDALEQSVGLFYHGKVQVFTNVKGVFEAEDFFEQYGEKGRWIYFTATPIRDVSQRHDVEAALQASQAFLAQIVDGSSVATFVIDRDHTVTHWNRACEALTGLPAKEVIGTKEQWRAFYSSDRPVMADLIMNGAMADDVDQFYHGKFRPSRLIEGVFEAEDFFAHFGTEGKWVFFTAAPLRDMDGSVVGAIETLQDMNERRLAEEALKASEARYRDLSITDGMTGLFNSRHFYECIEKELERARRYGRPLSLLLMDIDNFKKVNDQYGHLEGDKVLQSLAMVIRGCLREMDSAYRYGGEEFIVVLPETRREDAFIVAERLRQRFADQIQRPAPEQILHCTVSIGVSQFITGDDAKSLVKRADDGTYQAKHQGKNCVVWIDPA